MSSILIQASQIIENTVVVKINATGTINKSIHVALLIDTSGSMEGERIAAVIKSIKILINKLDINDSITLIGFSSKASTILSGEIITEINKSIIIDEVDKLIVGGGTNLENGIIMLGTLIQSNNITIPNSIVILTDGHINEGLSSFGGLYSLIKSYIQNIPIYTMGYGIDHNAILLGNIATKTRGSYTFIQNDNILPVSIGDMIGSLKSEVVSCATLKFPIRWTCLEPIAEDTNPFIVGSIIIDKPIWIVLHVPAESNVDNYLELCYNNSVVSFTNDTIMDPHEILEQLCRCKITKIMNNISSAMQLRSYIDAKKLITDGIELLNNSEAKNRPLVILMKAQLEETNEEVDKVIANQSDRDARTLQMRMTSLGGAYGGQRGTTQMSNGQPTNVFSSPVQRLTSNSMSRDYNNPNNI